MPLHAEEDGPRNSLSLGATAAGERSTPYSAKLGYAEVGEALARLVTGKPVKVSSAGVETLVLPPINTGLSRMAKEELL
jgi:hypothetical protein